MIKQAKQQELRAAAAEVVGAWENGDLAAAVRRLDAALKALDEVETERRALHDAEPPIDGSRIGRGRVGEDSPSYRSAMIDSGRGRLLGG